MLSKGKTKYFRDGAFRMELCLYIFTITLPLTANCVTQFVNYQLRHCLFLSGNPGHSSGSLGADTQRSSRIRTDRRKEKQTGTDQERSGNVRS